MSDPVTRDQRATVGYGVLDAIGGIGLFVIQFSAVIPGLLPFLILVIAFGAVLALPLVAVGAVLAVVAGPPYAVWRLVAAARRHRRAVPHRTAPVRVALASPGWTPRQDTGSLDSSPDRPGGHSSHDDLDQHLAA